MIRRSQVDTLSGQSATHTSSVLRPNASVWWYLNDSAIASELASCSLAFLHAADQVLQPPCLFSASSVETASVLHE
jgi:hypothetical protein